MKKEQIEKPTFGGYLWKYIGYFFITWILLWAIGCFISAKIIGMNPLEYDEVMRVLWLLAHVLVFFFGMLIHYDCEDDSIKCECPECGHKFEVEQKEESSSDNTALVAAVVASSAAVSISSGL